MDRAMTGVEYACHLSSIHKNTPLLNTNIIYT